MGRLSGHNAAQNADHFKRLNLAICFPDCDNQLQRLPRLHLLLRSGPLAQRQASPAFAELSPTRRPGREGKAQRMPCHYFEQSPGAAKVKESAAFKRQKRGPL